MPKLSFLSSSSSSSHHLLEPLPFLSTLRGASKMKTKASGFLKQVVSLLVSIVKAKSTAVKSKTSAVKTRLIIFGLLRNKKVLMSTISHKIHALMGQEYKEDGPAADHRADGTTINNDNDSKAIVPYTAVASEDDQESPDHLLHGAAASYHEVAQCGGRELAVVVDQLEEDDDGYPDLRHSLFDDEDDYQLGGSVIELVKNSRGEDEGEFVLEDEIDHVADVFIRRFHRQMRMQKLESFKRYQDMLERSV